MTSVASDGNAPRTIRRESADRAITMPPPLLEQGLDMARL
jgi:hypothetical protein